MTEEDSARRDAIRKVTTGHTDLNTFAIIRTILEGGHIYDSRSSAAKSRIIAICNKECARLLDVHDQGLAELKR
jgi:hypothetical protein